LKYGFQGHVLNTGQIIFLLAIWGLWVSKDAEFYVDFKKYNLPYRKIHLTKALSKITGLLTEK
jgi:hypothetical protein